MQADLDIHCSDVRLRVHSQLAEMDENLLPVGSCKKGLSVWASGVRTLDVSPSNGYPCSKFNSASSFSAKFFFLARLNCRNAIPCIVQIAAVVYAASPMTRIGSLRNILHQCSYKIDLILGQKDNRPANMTHESPDFGFACFAILV
ncbi:hypothetical protein T07_15044 [Trichinella nelsoni]|uniref:Uncharacterized protein n=1 Tax=Trichinella nelsoni TaxID=6336 RepID=A0A0V0RDK2_9BILA|nr:hypothetical protein T07_15044 [Trichinella nelsoni]